MQKSSNVVWHRASVTRERREKANGHRSVILWFTGLSGAGKSTLAHAVEERLHQLNMNTFVFDGDNVRHGLCSDLGFSEGDRVENIRRIGEMSKLIIEAGVIAMTAFISPFRADRERVRALVNEHPVFKFQAFGEKEENAIPFNLKDYLELVDWGGREVKRNKRGYIPLMPQG